MFSGFPLRQSEEGAKLTHRRQSVGGVGDEHAGLADGAVPNRDALDEPRRAHRSRSTLCSPLRTPPPPSPPYLCFFPRPARPPSSTLSPTSLLWWRLGGEQKQAPLVSRWGVDERGSQEGKPSPTTARCLQFCHWLPWTSSTSRSRWIWKMVGQRLLVLGFAEFVDFLFCITICFI
jgi:hypothetical protein